MNEVGPSAHIFKVDISRAFRHIQIDPGDIDLLGLQHRGKLYLDLSLPFGYCLGAFFFSKISDAVRYIISKNGHNALLKYIDDLIYCGLPSTIDLSSLDLILVLRSCVYLIQELYAWVYYSIWLTGPFQFQIRSYKKSVLFVITGRIREWSQKMSYSLY